MSDAVRSRPTTDFAVVRHPRDTKGVCRVALVSKKRNYEDIDFSGYSFLRMKTFYYGGGCGEQIEEWVPKDELEYYRNALIKQPSPDDEKENA